MSGDSDLHFDPAEPYGHWLYADIADTTIEDLKAALVAQVGRVVPEGYRWRVKFAHAVEDGVIYVAWLYPGNGDKPAPFATAEAFLAACRAKMGGP